MSIFSGIVNYANDIKAKSARVIGSNGVLLVSNRTIADSFEAQLRIPDSGGRVHHLSKPVKHISIAFSPKDTGRFPDNGRATASWSRLPANGCRRWG